MDGFKEMFRIIVVFTIVSGVLATIYQFTADIPHPVLSIAVVAFVFAGTAVLVTPFFQKATTPIDWRRPAYRASAIGSVLVIAAGSAFLGVWNFGATGGAPAPAVAITEPKFIERISLNEEVRGKAPNLARDETVWVLSSKINDSNLYLHDGPCTVEDPQTGDWRCPTWSIGEESDPPTTAFRIIAIRADADRSNTFVQYRQEYSRAQQADQELQTPETQRELDDAFARLTFGLLPVEESAASSPLIVQRM